MGKERVYPPAVQKLMTPSGRRKDAWEHFWTDLRNTEIGKNVLVGIAEGPLPVGGILAALHFGVLNGVAEWAAVPQNIIKESNHMDPRAAIAGLLFSVVAVGIDVIMKTRDEYITTQHFRRNKIIDDAEIPLRKPGSTFEPWDDTLRLGQVSPYTRRLRKHYKQ